MAKRKKYTEAQKAAALAALKANSGSLKKTSKDLGIAENTLRHWRKDEDAAVPADLRAAAELALLERFDKALNHGLDQAVNAGGNFQQLATGIAQLVTARKALTTPSGTPGTGGRVEVVVTWPDYDANTLQPIFKEA